MKQDVNNIDNLFREGLGGYTEVPPPDVWDALDKRLDNDRKKRPFAWRWFFVMLCGLGLFGSLFAWKMNGHSGETPDVAETSGIASIQQTPAQPQATTTGNTSAGSETQTTTVTHKKHAKRTNDINNTSNNTAVEQPANTTAIVTNNESSAAGAATKTTNTSILDNTAVAMAEPAPGTTNAPVRYVVNNKSRNNIVVAESEPAYSNNNYSTDESDEDEVTFGRKPVVENNEPKARNNYAASTRYDGRTIAAVTTAERRTNNTNTTTATRTVANAQPVAKGHGAGNSIAAATPRKKAARNNRRTNNGARNNPYSITNSKGNTAIATIAPAAKPVATIGSTVTAKVDNKQVAANTPVKNDTKTPKAEPNKPAAGVAVNNTKPEPVAKTTTVTTETTTVATTTPVKKAIAKRVKHTTVAAAVPVKEAVAKSSTTTATTVKKATTSKVSTTAVAKHESKKATHKATTTAAVTTLSAAKSTGGNSHVALATTTPSVHKKAKNGTKPTLAKAVSTVGETTAEIAKTAKTTTAVAKKDIQKPTAKTAENSSKTTVEPVAVVAKEKKIKGEQNTSNTASTGIAKRNKKKNNTKNKPEPTNVLSATTTETKQPETTATVAQVQPKTIPQETKVMSTFKDEPTPSIKPTETAPLPVPAAATAVTDSPAKKHLFGGFTYGVKAGYEGGVTSDASNKFVISPFIERRISSKFSVMAQPAIKSSKARVNGLSGTQTFYKTDPNGTVTNIDSFLIPVIQNNQTTGYLLRINLAYHETHDSIVKSYGTGGNYLEFELPIMLKYAINDKLSVYGGVSLNYSKFIQIKEYTYTSRPIVRNDTTFTIYPTAPAPISSVLKYAGNDISTYSGPLYPAQSGGLFRLGCMLGVSYEIRKRWLIDAMYTKAPAKTNIQGGYDVNKGLSTSYFRFTLGYRLSK